MHVDKLASISITNARSLLSLHDVVAWASTSCTSKTNCEVDSFPFSRISSLFGDVEGIADATMGVVPEAMDADVIEMWCWWAGVFGSGGEDVKSGGASVG